MNTDADWCSPPESVFICVYHLLSVFFPLKNKRVDQRLERNLIYLIPGLIPFARDDGVDGSSTASQCAKTGSLFNVTKEGTVHHGN